MTVVIFKLRLNNKKRKKEYDIIMKKTRRMYKKQTVIRIIDTHINHLQKNNVSLSSIYL